MRKTDVRMATTTRPTWTMSWLEMPGPGVLADCLTCSTSKEQFYEGLG